MLVLETLFAGLERRVWRVQWKPVNPAKPAQLWNDRGAQDPANDPAGALSRAADRQVEWL